MSQARALHRVQEIELSVIERTKRIKEINALLEDNEIVQEAQQEFDRAEEKLDTAAKAVKDMELQIEAVANKQKATETRLYSGNVTNPKELQDMQNEIASLTRRRGDLDDKLLELMVARDEAQAEFDQAEADLKSITEDWEAEHQDLLEEKETLTSESEKLMVDRKKALQAVEPSAMKIYNSLRKTKANRPVATVEGNTCTACGIEQNNAIISELNRDDKLVYCHNCGRILVR